LIFAQHSNGRRITAVRKLFLGILDLIADPVRIGPHLKEVFTI
jgi:hypothetical protein